MKSITEKGVNYLELTANKNGEIKCPFCWEIHKHGIRGKSGHRLAHCRKGFIQNPVFLDGKWHFKKDGYFVKFIQNKSDMNIMNQNEPK